MGLDSVIALLKNVGATGAGVGQFHNTNAPYTVQVKFTNTGGSVTALSVALEGSLDGVNYSSLHDLGTPFAFSASELTAKSAMYHISNRDVFYVRGNVTTLTATGTTAITMLFQGS